MISLPTTWAPRVGSLFSGVGGIDLGLERSGMDIRFQVEIDPYCSAVLARHFPDARRWYDIRTVHGRGQCDYYCDTGGADCPRCLEPVDVLAGGFPCPPVSVAGRRRGDKDPRWLWPEFARLIGELEPAYVLIENVPGLRTLGLRGVLADLAHLGYDTEWHLVSAAQFGAPHIRQRLVILGDAGSSRCEEQCGPSPVRTELGDAERTSRGGAQPGVRRVADELPEGMDGAATVGAAVLDTVLYGSPAGVPGPLDPDPWESEWVGVPRVARGVALRVDRLTALGNAVVPALAEWAGRCIMADIDRRTAAKPEPAIGRRD
jgi:DNA (cytosine-5)-methyltransferase 1